MKSLFEELGGTYTLGKDGMYYPNLAIEETDQRSIGKWGRMHREYLREQYPSLYERLILNGTLDGHLADANERATNTNSNLKSFRLRASFPFWRCFIPVNVALLRLPSFSLARMKNPSRILELF